MGGGPLMSKIKIGIADDNKDFVISSVSILKGSKIWKSYLQYIMVEMHWTQ